MICFVPHHVNNSSHLICWDFLTITEYWPLPMFSGIWYNARSRSWIILSCSLSSYLGYYFTCGVIIGLFLCASLNVHLLNFMCKFFALSASLTGFFCTSWQLVLLLTNLNNLMPSAIFGSSQLTSFLQVTHKSAELHRSPGAPLVISLRCKNHAFSPALVPDFKPM